MASLTLALVSGYHGATYHGATYHGATYHGATYHGASYHGPPELTLARAFTEWTLDGWALGFVLLLGGLYLAGVRRVRRSGTHWPRGRIVSFCGLGLGFCVIATMSWVGVYQPVLFYARSVQTILMLLVVPLFLALGRPLTLVIASLPRLGPRIEAAIRGRIAKALTFPAITTLVLVVVPFAVYFTPVYAAGFHSVAVAQLTHLALMAPGFVFFWTLLRVDPVPKAYPYLVSLWVTGVEVVGDAVLGLAVIADQNLIAGAYYHALARPWGPSLATDQVLGGGVLWILGDIVGLPFLAVQLIQMIREDEADAVVIDAELDAREAAPLKDSTPADRPWWESDPRFTDRFQPVEDSVSPRPSGDDPPSESVGGASSARE
jgi:cytochrome c oxidase assembly factor CtaG